MSSPQDFLLRFGSEIDKSFGAIPERPISAHPALKFCSAFVFYFLMYCLE